MKRVTPARDVKAPEYPSAEQAGVTRRGALHLVLGGAAALGSILLEDPAEARRLRGVKPRPRYTIAIRLTPPYRFRGCKSAIVEILGRTYSRDVQQFFGEAAQQKAIQHTIRSVLRKHRCADLKGNQRYVLLAELRKRLTELYRLRRKRRYGDIRWLKLRES